MSLVAASLIVLACGAAGSLAAWRAPRTSIVISMGAVFVAAVLMLAAAFSVLVKSGHSETDLTWPMPLGLVRLSLDGLSAWFLMTVALVAAGMAPYTVAYMRHAAKNEPLAPFGALLCMLVASLTLLVCAADAVLFLVAWEFMTLCAFLLILFHDKDENVRHGAWMYLIATHLGTAAGVLPLFAILFARTGGTSFDEFSETLTFASPGFLTLLFALAVIGFGTKAGFFPMHVWLPAAHPVAPTPVSALLSGVVVKSGLYGILRMLTWLPPLPLWCGQALMILGIVSGVMGVLYALAQHDLKRLLAYHTVENIGIIAIGIAVGMIGETTGNYGVAALGYGGALLHVTNHALFKGLLFLSAGAVLQGTGTVQIEKLGGLSRRMPGNSAMFLLGAVAICGLPPLNGFVSEWVIYNGLFTGMTTGDGVSAGMQAAGIFSVALMGGLALACFAKVFGVVFIGEPREHFAIEQTPRSMIVGMLVLALPCVVIGMLPVIWTPLSFPAISALTGGDVLDSAPFDNVWLNSRFTLTLLVLLGMGVVLGTLRRRGSVERVPTWGCGYAYPSARMQYTATSFAMPLVTSFRGLLWPARHLVAPSGAFPTATHVHTHTSDLAEQDLFRPLFSWIGRLLGVVRHVTWSGAPAVTGISRRSTPLAIIVSGFAGALRRGSIHACLVFIVITLITLFFVEILFAENMVDSGINTLKSQTTEMIR